MNILRIDIKSFTASFRNPQNMKIQDSVPFPPPTTIVGILGAAFGYEHFRALEEFSDLLLGIKVREKHGEGFDLWAIKKTDKSRGTQKSIVKRQFFYMPGFSVYLGSENKPFLEKIAKALKKPVYPLSLGRDDELITEIGATLTETFEIPEGEIENVVVKGRLSPQNIEVKLSEVAGEINKFQVFRLAKNFNLNKRTGARYPSGYNEYTFIDRKIKYLQKLYVVESENIPLWRWNV